MNAFSINNQFNKVILINHPTPVERLSRVAAEWKVPQLFVKREDHTEALYGGNKVRNLEFLLGDAIQKKAAKILAIAPFGSNFIAALAAQSMRVGIPVNVMHFVAEKNLQIELHASFSKTCKAKLSMHSEHYLGSLSFAALNFVVRKMLEPNVYTMPVGGSSAIGALGHVQAAIELAEQIKRDEIAEPDFLFVGVGTCGTMAGLQVGLDIAGLKTQLIGIRCVDKVFCHRKKIARLANEVTQRLKLAHLYSAKKFVLLDLPTLQYGKTLSEAAQYVEQFKVLENIVLDTTYTSKVVFRMKSFIDEFQLHSDRILFWNTFSPNALKADSDQLLNKHHRQSDLQ